jgi:hypothetical protein
VTLFENLSLIKGKGYALRRGSQMKGNSVAVMGEFNTTLVNTT